MHKIIGLRVEKYLGTTCVGHNCDFEYGKEERDRHVFLLKSPEGDYKELTLSYEEGECGSGWCCASFGEYGIEVVNTFKGKTHKPVTEMFVNLNHIENLRSEDTYDCEAFSFSYDGGDCYYPSGGYSVNMDNFRGTEEDA